MRAGMIRRWTPSPAHKARARALLSRGRLPGGFVDGLDRHEKADRRFILRHVEQHGPVFSATAWNAFWVCVVGADRCRRLLAMHADHLRPYTLTLDGLFAGGFLRQMRGPQHAACRQALVGAIRACPVERAGASFARLVSRRLASLYQRQAAGWTGPEELLRALSSIATTALIEYVFGAPDGSTFSTRLDSGFVQLGPHGLVWNVGPRQKAAFHALSTTVREHLDGPGAPTPEAGLAPRLHGRGELDDTMLGNLIYMVEMGRYDVRGLLRWLTRYAAAAPEACARIASHRDEAPRRALSTAFVMETLRMDQSERLVRTAERTLRFDGFVIPKHTMVRLCMWESHKDPDVFHDPFHFDIERFTTAPPPTDVFSPFGLDHHYCPFAGIVVALAGAFVESLTSTYTVTGVGDGAPVRGAYHWEPSPLFTVRLLPRAHDGTKAADGG